MQQPDIQYAPPPFPPPHWQDASSSPDASSSTMQYAPPPFPPPARPLLKPSSPTPYPIDLELLAHQGWVSLPDSISTPHDPLYVAYANLFASSAQFFTLPDADKEKYKITHKDTSRASEEGYSHIPGEKALVTLRRTGTTPTEFELRERVDEAWKASASVMYEVLGAIEESLGMEKGALERTAGPQREIPREGKDVPVVASLMRMFRYERPTGVSNDPNPTSLPAAEDLQEDKQAESSIVSEAHKDLGLLTIVVGHTPGLECWSPVQQRWIACEEPIPSSQGTDTDTKCTPRLCATLLAGQTLSKFTNNRYASGRHRVLVHPSQMPSTTDTVGDTSPLLAPQHRFSLVHALRAHYPVRVSSSAFTTRVTGAFAPDAQFADVPVREIYQSISGKHWNVNIDPEIRRRQQREALGLKDGIDEGKSGEEGEEKPGLKDAGQADAQTTSVPDDGAKGGTKSSKRLSVRLGQFKSLFKRSSVD